MLCIDSILHGQSFDYLNTKERYALLMSIYFRYQYLDNQGITFSSDCNSTLDSLLVNCLTQSVEHFLEVNKLQSNYDSTNILNELLNYSNGSPNHAQWEGIISSIDSVLLIDSITTNILFDQLDTIDFDLSFCTEDTLPSADLSNSIRISNSSFINDSISNAEEDQLLAIATSCYSEAGLAKYHARATLNEYGIAVPEPTCIGIRDRKSILKTNKLYITPNPADNVLHIEIDKAGNYSIIDLNGKVLRSDFLNKGRSSIDILNLKEGIYIIYCEETKTHARFVKI